MAAALYGLIESAQLCAVDPNTFLRETVRRELDARGSAPLPHAFVAAREQRTGAVKRPQ